MTQRSQSSAFAFASERSKQRTRSTKNGRTVHRVLLPITTCTNFQPNEYLRTVQYTSKGYKTHSYLAGFVQYNFNFKSTTVVLDWVHRTRYQPSKNSVRTSDAKLFSSSLITTAVPGGSNVRTIVKICPWRIENNYFVLTLYCTNIVSFIFGSAKSL